MKRRSQSTNNQPLLKKPGIPDSTDTLRSKIATKLQSVFDGFVSDLQNISKEKEPDLTVLFVTQHVSNFVKDSQNANHTLSDGDDNSTLILQNFINSAKSRISGLLNKEQTFQKINDGILETTHESYPQGNVKTVIVDPLQIQISLKVQSLLCKALDNVKFISNGKSQNVSSRNISESELQHLSRMLQDFMKLAKQRLSLSLSKGHSKHSSTSVKSENSGFNPSWQSHLCNVPQASLHSHKHCYTNKLFSAPCELDSNCEFLKQSSIQCKLNKVGKENLHFLLSGSRTTSIYSYKMYSPHLSDSDSFESALCIPNVNRSCNSYENGKGGMIFLEDSERAPEYLDLEINTDVEDQAGTDSDEEVIVLGEKHPTYEEITLEEDDEEEVHENMEQIADKPEGNATEIEELLFNCPKCEKVFRVESLLKFHVRMHGVEDPPLASASESSPEKQSPNSDDESSSTKASKIYQGSTRKEKENKTKSKSKRSSHKQKLHREKRLKYDKKRNISKHS